MMKIERRIVTILFSDLVGFTTMSEQFQPEDVALIQDRYFQRVKDAVDLIWGLDREIYWRCRRCGFRPSHRP